MKQKKEVAKKAAREAAKTEKSAMKKRSRLLKVPCAVVVVNCSFVVQLLDRPPEDCQLKIFAKFSRQRRRAQQLQRS